MVKKEEVSSKKKITIIIFSIVLFLALLFIAYFVFFYTKSCATFECFQEGMRNCKKVSFVNEEPQASWEYTVKGISNSECSKKGELQLENLNGFEMLCSYPKGMGTYPDKDLNRCHGRLKEELQTIIINKIHTYILEDIKNLNATAQ
jgi:hypothetical protein